MNTRRLVIAVVVLTLVAAAVTGSVIYYESRGPTRQQAFLTELTSHDVSHLTRHYVRQHPGAAVATGRRACGWAKVHPWDGGEDDPAYQYATSISTHDLVDVSVNQDIVDTAWQHLCPSSHMSAEDD